MAPHLRQAPTAGSGSAPVARIGAIAAATLVGAGVAAQLIDYGLYDLRIRALDSNAEGAILELLGDAALLGAAVAAWFLAMWAPRRAAKVALSVVLTFLAVDRLVGLHEHVPHWRVVYLPILVATLVGLAAVARDLKPAAVRLLIGGVVLLSASLVLHELGEWLMARLGAVPDGWVYQVKLAVKHGTEASGWLLVALGLAHGQRGRGCAVMRHSGRGTRR
jgi:hypothetical protein